MEKEKSKETVLVAIASQEDDLLSYHINYAKKGEIYALKVVKRKRNLIGFDLVKIK